MIGQYQHLDLEWLYVSVCVSTTKDWSTNGWDHVKDRVYRGASVKGIGTSEPV